MKQVNLFRTISFNLRPLKSSKSKKNFEKYMASGQATIANESYAKLIYAARL